MKIIFIPFIVMFELFEMFLLSFCKTNSCSLMSGAGGRMADKTDEERNKEYSDVPDRIPTLRECLTKKK